MLFLNPGFQYLCSRYHPHFGRKIEHRIQQLMGAGYKFRMLMSEDGSGKGAAIIAAALSMEQGIHYS